jgi:SCF-associated factor 1
MTNTNIFDIRVANGDYHWGALTSSGRLYTWGAYSNGALGLGHPSLENTRLSSPRPPTSSSQRAPTSSVTTIPATATLPPQRIFTIPRLPRNPQILQPPSTTTRPTRVVFPGESLDDEAVAQEDETVENDSEEGKERSGKFVFNFSCGGSHSGVLAIDLSEDVVEDIVDDCEEVEVEEGEEERTEEGGVQGSSIFQFFNPFRIGFAGRPDRTD